MQANSIRRQCTSPNTQCRCRRTLHELHVHLFPLYSPQNQTAGGSQEIGYRGGADARQPLQEVTGAHKKGSQETITTGLQTCGNSVMLNPCAII